MSTQPPNLTSTSTIYNANSPPLVVMPPAGTPNPADSIMPHPNAPKDPSLLSLAFNLIGRFFEWILSWFYKPKPKPEGVQPNQLVSPGSSSSASQEVSQTTPSTPVAPFKDAIKKFEISAWTFGSYIGNDQKYQFSKSISLMDDTPLQVAPTDLYWEIHQPQSCGKTQAVELPSSLILQANNRNTISFIWQETLYILSFTNDVLETLKAAMIEAPANPTIFRYEEDIPPDYVYWDSGSDAVVILSPKCQRIYLDQQGASPLDFSNLKTLPGQCNLDRPQKREFIRTNPSEWNLQLLVAGTPEVDILLDHDHLLIHIDHSNDPSLEPSFPQSKTCCDTIKLHSFYSAYIPYKIKNYDSRAIRASISECFLTITIPSLQSNPLSL